MGASGSRPLPEDEACGTSATVGVKDSCGKKKKKDSCGSALEISCVFGANGFQVSDTEKLTKEIVEHGGCLGAGGLSLFVQEAF